MYIDDILVTGRTEGEHLQNLTQVLQRLAEAGMRLKREKCAYSALLGRLLGWYDQQVGSTHIRE